MDHVITYSEFVSRVVSCVAPLLPEGSPLRMFCGCETFDFVGRAGESRRILPSADSARLHGGRAVAFSMLAGELAPIAGMSPEAFACKNSEATGEAYADVSVYARNLRRWANQNQLPRKIRARVEFCVVAALWTFGWDASGEGGSAGTAEHLECQLGLLEVAEEVLQARVDGLPDSPYDMAAILWEASARAYENSKVVNAVD